MLITNKGCVDGHNYNITISASTLPEWERKFSSSMKLWRSTATDIGVVCFNRIMATERAKTVEAFLGNEEVDWSLRLFSDL